MKKNITFAIATSEMELADGYPEYEDVVNTKEELKEAKKRAENYGVPAQRLTVTEQWEDDEGQHQHEEIGTLESVLYDLNK